MNKTELEIIQQLASLDEAQQERVLRYLTSVAQANEPRPLSLGEWVAMAEPLREQLRQHYGEAHFHSQSILDEIREEESE